MAESRIVNNPAYIGNSVEVIDSSFTSGTAKEVTIPKDGYYFLVATSGATSCDVIAAFYADPNLLTIISFDNSSGTHQRRTTAVIPFKAGTKVTCRVYFNDYARLCRLY